jgi:hypothetical protein
VRREAFKELAKEEAALTLDARRQRHVGIGVTFC